MKATYDLKFPDLLELHMHLGRPMMMKKRWLIATVFFSAFVLIMIMVTFPILDFLESGDYVLAVLFVIPPVIFLHLGIQNAFFFDKKLRRTYREILEGKNYATYYGRNEIDLTPGYIVRVNEYRTEMVQWRGIRRIDETEKHIFILDTDMSAFIIPKRAFSSKKEERAFLSEARGYLESSRTDEKRSLEDVLRTAGSG